MLVCINDGADQGIVDGIPDLQDDDQQGVPCTQTHDLRPEQSHRALQGETHVAAKVTGCIGNTVANTEGTEPIGIQLGSIFSHMFFLFSLIFNLHEKVKI